MKMRWIGVLMLVVTGLQADPVGSEHVIVHGIKDAKTAEALRALAAKGDAISRGRALEVLSDVGDASDHPRMLEALTDADPMVRLTALRICARHGLAPSPSRLDALWNDPHPAVRAGVPGALAEGLQGKVDEDRLERALSDPDPHMRYQAARLVVSRRTVTLQEAFDAGEARIRRLYYRNVLEGAERQTALVRGFRHADAGVRAAAYQALDPSDAGHTAAVRTGCTDPALTVRLAAIGAAARLRTPGYLPDLYAMLADGDPIIQQAVCRALGAFPEAVGALETVVLETSDPWVVQAALEALLHLGTDPALDSVAATQSREEPELRLKGLKILGSWPTPAAGKVLLGLRDRTTDEEWIEVLSGLAAFRPGGLEAWRPELERLLDHSSMKVQGRAARLLGILKAPGLPEQVLPWVQDPRPEEPGLRREVAWRILTAYQTLGHESLALRYLTKPVIPPAPGIEWSYASDPVRIAALAYLVDTASPRMAEKIFSGFEALPSLDLRVRLAESLSEMTGDSWEVIPVHQYRRWFVESIGLPEQYQPPPLPGVRRLRATGASAIGCEKRGYEGFRLFVDFDLERAVDQETRVKTTAKTKEKELVPYSLPSSLSYSLFEQRRKWAPAFHRFRNHPERFESSIVLVADLVTRKGKTETGVDENSDEIGQRGKNASMHQIADAPMIDGSRKLDFRFWITHGMV